MADRVLVLGLRPTVVRNLHHITLPKVGRDPVELRSDPLFTDYFARIWADLDKPREAVSTAA